MSGHTPESWHVRLDERDQWYRRRIYSGDDLIANVLPHRDDEAKANLIAAAPELLDAVRYLCAEIRNGCDRKSEAFMRGVEMAEDIAAKAEGRDE